MSSNYERGYRYTLACAGLIKHAQDERSTTVGEGLGAAGGGALGLAGGGAIADRTVKKPLLTESLSTMIPGEADQTRPAAKQIMNIAEEAGLADSARLRDIMTEPELLKRLSKTPKGLGLLSAAAAIPAAGAVAGGMGGREAGKRVHQQHNDTSQQMEQLNRLLEQRQGQQ